MTARPPHDREPGVQSSAHVNGPAPRERPGPGNGGMSSDARSTLLALVEAARVLREAVRDKSYRATQLGQLVGRYVRWCRNERGLVDGTTIRDYEYTLARMALTLADLEPEEVTIDDLRTVIDLWAEREPRTRKKVTSAIRSFWKWAEDEGHVKHSPASRLRSPKVPMRAPDLSAAGDRHPAPRRGRDRAGHARADRSSRPWRSQGGAGRRSRFATSTSLAAC